MKTIQLTYLAFLFANSLLSQNNNLQENQPVKNEKTEDGLSAIIADIVAKNEITDKDLDKIIDYASKNKIDQDFYISVDFNKLKEDDEDNDGINDFKDECHQTPPGVKVDKKGCPLDEDEDMVPDYRDKELNTPKNITANADGIGITKKMQIDWNKRFNEADKKNSISNSADIKSKDNKNSNKTKINEDLKKTMNDSLYAAIMNFFEILNHTIAKEMVTKKDVELFLEYTYKHMADTLQTSENFFPYDDSKENAIKNLRKQTNDLVGKKCKFIDGGWDGWDGKSPYTSYRFDIEHDNYLDQFIMILSTKNKITCIYSADSIDH
jgi:hypothetical protein